MSKLIVFSGPPCSGKTTLANIISGIMDVPRLGLDDFMSPQSDYCEEDRNQAYVAMHDRAQELLENGHDTVILDATYARFSTKFSLTTLISATNAQVELIECMIGPKEAVRRWENREGHPAVDMTKERAYLLAKNHPYSGGGLLLRTDTEIEKCVGQIFDYLEGA